MNTSKKIIGYPYCLLAAIYPSFCCYTVAFVQPIPIKFKPVSAADGVCQGQGLNKYDGYKMVIYRNDPKDSRSISNNSILGLCEASQKNLWIVPSNRRNLYNRKRNNFTTFRNRDRKTSLSNNYVLSVSSDQIGHVWMGAFSGSNRFNPKDSSSKGDESP